MCRAAGSGLTLVSVPPLEGASARRDFLSANLRPVTASLRHTEAGKSPTGSIRRLEGWSLTEPKTADGFVSRRGTWKPGPAVGAGRRPRRPLVLTQKTAPTAGLPVN